MQPQRPRPRVKWTSSARERVNEEVRENRTRLLQVFNIIDEALPREAELHLDAESPQEFRIRPWSHNGADRLSLCGQLFRDVAAQLPARTGDDITHGVGFSFSGPEDEDSEKVECPRFTQVLR